MKLTILVLALASIASAMATRESHALSPLPLPLRDCPLLQCGPSSPPFRLKSVPALAGVSANVCRIYQNAGGSGGAIRRRMDPGAGGARGGRPSWQLVDPRPNGGKWAGAALSNPMRPPSTGWAAFRMAAVWIASGVMARAMHRMSAFDHKDWSKNGRLTSWFGILSL
ncbi:hypothetical protein BDK51DRAFT_49585 [Blyttiomyces helicus]|uniref:Uncharacterized protein n=1 Tax=Blyttiomyces helicus TaxID=388810 RepID=A0A4P9WEL5_9FUNG|nr:hypothetical protein BDK51DRAFT_49585 [Blyttiomyces helicus]|eukprot:RKO91044.1 hypothetical protein BDK51DRAFT_49585 [Blyttiomyces helicus]